MSYNDNIPGPRFFPEFIKFNSSSRLYIKRQGHFLLTIRSAAFLQKNQGDAHVPKSAAPTKKPAGRKASGLRGLQARRACLGRDQPSLGCTHQ